MRLTLFAALITLVACSGAPVADGGGGGSSSNGGGSSSNGGGSSSNGGGSSSSGGGSSSSGGGASNSGGGTSSSGGGTSSSGGGTSSSGGGTSSSGGGTSSSGGGTSSTGGGTSSSGGGTGSTGGGTTSGSAIKKVFVIALENQGTSAVYQNNDAAYLNALMGDAGYATMYGDVLSSSTPSEPHYVWMEAGTATFTDHTFTGDSDPGTSGSGHGTSATNSTASVNHLATQLMTAGKSWRAYQEDLDASINGACPISTGDGLTNFYGAKHDPFVFFQDVVGTTPSTTNMYCSSHHKKYTQATLQADLTANDVADYTFITPNLCDDMHGGLCSNGCVGVSGCVKAGDAWLKTNVPPIINYVNAHDGVLFLVWDEPESSGNQPFVVVGPHVKKGHISAIAYNHSSYLKSLEEIFEVPVMSNVQSANDFSDFFDPGYFP
jgi:hypothetical protein